MKTILKLQLVAFGMLPLQYNLNADNSISKKLSAFEEKIVINGLNSFDADFDYLKKCKILVWLNSNDNNIEINDFRNCELKYKTNYSK